MLDKEIVSYMRIFHLGEHRGALSRELEVVFHIHSRELREIVSRLRSEGVPICSSDYGYFYAANEEELNRTIRQLTSRITKIARARGGLINARALYSDDGQLRLPLKGGDDS